MGIRVLLCPIIGTGFRGSEIGVEPVVPADPYRVSVTGVCDYTAFLPSNANGTPAFTWALVLARAPDWTAVDLLTGIDRVFGIDLPDSIDTFGELRAYLKSKFVGDIPALRRQALDARLTARGIDTSQVTLATTWWQVLRGIYRHLNGGEDIAGDGVTL